MKYFRDSKNYYCYNPKNNTLTTCFISVFRGQKDSGAMNSKVSLNTHCIGQDKKDKPLFSSEASMLEGKTFINQEEFARAFNLQLLDIYYHTTKKEENEAGKV